MNGIISVNVKKIKMTAKVNDLIGENYREEKNAKKYDDGHRIIDTGKTKDNVFLLERPADYDAFRKDRINRVNEARAERGDMGVHLKGAKEKLREDGKLQAEATRKAAATRKLRADTVDTLGLVVQPSADFINNLSPAEQTKFFSDALEVMQAHPDWFGRIETAVIHYDENTPHMQCLASAINEDTLTSEAKKIVGNKSKMSDRQTKLAQWMQEKGWDVERGIKRVNNPDYQNWKSEMERQGYKVNRYNDAKLMAEHNKIKQERIINDMYKSKNDVERTNLDIEKNRLENNRAVFENEKRQLENDKELFQRKEEWLERNEVKLQNRKKELDEREKSLENMEKQFEEKYKKLIASLNAKASEREASRNKEHNTLLEALNAQIRAEKEKMAELCEREKKLFTKEAELKQMQEKNEAKETELKRMQSELDCREKSFTNSKKRTAELIKGMAADMHLKTDAELEQRKAELMKAEEANDFTEMVSQIDAAGDYQLS